MWLRQPVTSTFRRRERDEEYEAYKQVRVRQRNESRSPGGPSKFNDYQ